MKCFAYENYPKFSCKCISTNFLSCAEHLEKHVNEPGKYTPVN